GITARFEFGKRSADDALELFHRCPEALVGKKKGGGLSPPALAAQGRPKPQRRILVVVRSPDQAREALACSAILPNAALSYTARSARTLRSMSMPALLKPFMN